MGSEEMPELKHRRDSRSLWVLFSLASVSVRNKPVARASTGLIMFGRGPAARVAVVSVSELSPYPGRAAIEQLVPVYACVMGVCLQLAAYAAWWSCMKSVAIRREL
jgi:hypothetical protein